MSIKVVELTEAEKALLTRIDFNPDPRTHNHIAARDAGEATLELMRSLIRRDAIPAIRLRYFGQPQYVIGSGNSSRADIFAKNGTKGEDIFRHPHFLKHLHYFLYGPALPQAVIDAFCSEVSACGRVTSGDIIPLGNFAKQQVRSHGLDRRDSTEEFFKLALECDLDLDDARFIRSAVMKVR